MGKQAERKKPRRPQHAFPSMLQRSNNRLWGCHFPVPGDVAQQVTLEGSRRVVCRLNDAIEYQCALIPHGNGKYVITVNTQVRKHLGIGVGDEVEVVLVPDRSEYGLPFPDELREVLRLDKEGNRLFHALTPGRQRTLLYIIGKGKQQDRRIDRAVVVVAHLKARKGKIDYKQLSQELKSRRKGIAE